MDPAQLDPIKKEINEVKTNCTSNTTRVSTIEKERKMKNIIITGLMPRHQNPSGLCEFAYNEMGVSIGEEDIADMYLILGTHDRVVHLVRFANQSARNNFFRGKIQLSPRARVWINEDLTKLKESIAYECRLRYKGGKILRCWTYSGDVYIQVDEESDAIKIDKISDLPATTELDPETDRALRRPRPEPRPNFRQLRFNRGGFNTNAPGRIRRNSTGVPPRI